MGSNQFFFDMRGSFFLLKLGKTSSGKHRWKKFLGKSDVGWSNTWWDRTVLLRARNAFRRAPVDFVSVLKKNTFTLHAIKRWLLKNLFYVPQPRKLVFPSQLRVKECCIFRYRGIQCRNWTANAHIVLQWNAIFFLFVCFSLLRTALAPYWQSLVHLNCACVY